MFLVEKKVKKNLNNIKCLILDVDGVLTDGTFYLSEDGKETKRFHTHDGQGLKLLMQNNIEVAIISSRESQAVNKRMDELGITLVYQGQKEKLVALKKILEQLSLTENEIAYMGDDLADLPVMEKVGLAIAPKNAVDIVKKTADWITEKKGGKGAVREVCDKITQNPER